MPQSLVKEDKPGETKLDDARRNFHLDDATASSALGYNQLLMANTLAKFEEQPAAIAGKLKELSEQNHDVPTPNFFSQAGYNGNPVSKGRTASELLLQIERAMQGPNNDVNVRPGQADFDKAFQAVN